MLRTKMFGAVLSVAVFGLMAFPVTAEDKEPVPISDIMKAHKEGLHKKAAMGTATPEEMKKLVSLYTDLGKNEPPKGDEESWKKLCDALLTATKDLAEGKPGAAAAFNKAVNCAGCHKAHK